MPLEDLVATDACPECGTPRTTDAPFSVSGPNEGRATALPRKRDRSGFTSCTGCGLVDDAFYTLDSAPPPEPVGSQYQNHYDRLIRRHTSYDMRRGTRISKLAVPRLERDRVTSLSGILYDADALLAQHEIKGDLKDDVLHAIERYYRDGKTAEWPRVRYEAIIVAVTYAVLKARARNEREVVHFAGLPLWASFNVSATTQSRATERVARWFRTYWRT